jgi:hypothetical protein
MKSTSILLIVLAGFVNNNVNAFGTYVYGSYWFMLFKVVDSRKYVG